MKGKFFEGDFYPVYLRWFRLPGVRWLLAAPDVVQYGHIGLELLFSLAKARDLGVPLYIVRPKQVVSEAFFDLIAPEVRMVRDTPLRRRLLGWYWNLASWLDAFVDWRYAFRVEYGVQKRRAIAAFFGAWMLDRELRDRLKAVRAQVGDETDRLAVETANKDVRPYYRRKEVIRPLKLTFREPALRQAQDAAARWGLTPDTPIVMLHVREAGWKLGREIQVLKPSAARDDSVRNAHVESHLPAVDYLVDRGFTVVRMGDPSMTPLRRRGVIDLATAQPREQLLELYCLLRCRFLLCSESGPLGVSYFTGTPSLAVNCTDPISAFPVRKDCLYLLKTVIDRRTGERLRLQDLLSERYVRHLRDTTRFQYVENTAEEILAAVREMLELLENAPAETAAQRAYRRLVTEVGEDLRYVSNYVLKWGADEGFMGDGRMVTFACARDFPSNAAETTLHAARTTATASAVFAAE